MVQAGRFQSLTQRLAHHILYTIFFETSTRTSFSFQTAALRLGMQVVNTENAGLFSSAAKGESLEDAFNVYCGYGPSAIVLRHSEEGSAKRAAAIADRYGVPIINAGDGKGEHPTQALLDLYTIQRRFAGINGLTVVLVGDLANGRTGRSLCRLLCHYRDIKFIFVAPEKLQMGADICKEITAAGLLWEKTSDLKESLYKADVVYVTRVQLERLSPEEREGFQNGSPLRIGTEEMVLLKKGGILLHPLPRVDEITAAVDRDPRALYFEQAANGLFVRMAVLDMLTHPIE